MAQYRNIFDKIRVTMADSIAANPREPGCLQLKFPGTEDRCDPVLLMPITRELVHQIKSNSDLGDWFLRFGLLVLAWNLLDHWTRHRKVLSVGIYSSLSPEGELITDDGVLSEVAFDFNRPGAPDLFLAIHSAMDGEKIRLGVFSVFETGLLSLEMLLDPADDTINITSIDFDTCAPAFQKAIAILVLSFWPRGFLAGVAEDSSNETVH